VARTDRSMKETVGGHFQTIAKVTAGDVSQFVNDRVLSAGTLAANPVVVDACTNANAAYGAASPAAIQDRINSLTMQMIKKPSQGKLYSQFTWCCFPTPKTSAS